MNVERSPVAGLDAADAAARLRRLERNVERVFRGSPEAVRLAVICLVARGHMLIEDVPGVGKTTLAQALARSLGLTFQRIQFTSDLLPSDILGVSIWNQHRETFEFVPGPIFASVVLADEINRATPKTQSALLEAMSERQVTVERKRLDLPDPFLVLATQNPLEYLGTFPLPESQLDRFEMHLRLGYPGREQERDLLLAGGVAGELERLEPVLSGDELRELQRGAEQVTVAPRLVDYVLAIAARTRQGEPFQLGVSTRAALGLCRAAQAMALAEGRDFVAPDDVQRLAVPVLGHRVLLRRGASSLDAARRALEQVVAETPVPV
ncbi:MAG: MoxR family ATPase [Thermoanaerobaculia bacterium]|nr:MoxR family ATPase [Thermoanaerobaculia bacterium]